MKTAGATTIRVADETWIATALLHREQPDREDFTVQEIIQRARLENLTGELRPGVGVHASWHCVANRPPKPATLRMLYATGKSTRRLYREGDDADPKRHGRITPEREALPPKYRYLLDWYQKEFASGGPDSWLRGIRELAGMGREIFKGVDPDEYVRQLREGWA
ncbi:MAG TPA: hypothetical protein VLY24_14780 [Bryobacteraceae bacterium]|nr:hypothetical protein [Bryobacteraceae bacterium]